MNDSWARQSVFYHIYPLGLCGAPAKNDYTSPPVPRLHMLHRWVEHMDALGFNALYLGPLFESGSHGYDTVDYYNVDRRLGDNDTLAELSEAMHRRGIRLILDGVFNHVGRDFRAFRDVRHRGPESPFCSWFKGLNFDGRSPHPYNDPFRYEGWDGHYSLVKLNLASEEVKTYLFRAIEMWHTRFHIDGLRLDAADCLEEDFIGELSAFCKSLNPDFWLMGEIVHGDYRKWAHRGMCDSVTNYECYKGLYSSLVDRNYFEIAYALKRQFGKDGLYKDLPLYAFADNHDVNRVASNLKNPDHLYPLYCMLFTMPGVPSVYYGSEWGIEGRKEHGSDHSLRPQIDIEALPHRSPHRDLTADIARLARLRRASPALCQGDYREMAVTHEQIAFMRSHGEERVIVVINASVEKASMTLKVPECGERSFYDLLDGGEHFRTSAGTLHIETVHPCRARILSTAVH